LLRANQIYKAKTGAKKLKKEQMMNKNNKNLYQKFGYEKNRN